MGIGFCCRKNACFPGVHKIGAAISGPRIAGKNFYGHEDFSDFLVFRDFGWVFVGRHLVGVWIGGVWNGHFPESEKSFSEAEFSRKIPEKFRRKSDFFAKFRAPKFGKNQSPKICNSIPPAIPYPHRTPSYFRRFRKGVGGRGLATNKPPKRAQKVLQKCEGGKGKRVQKRGLNLWPLKGFFAPTPSVRQPLFETPPILGL